MSAGRLSFIGSVGMGQVGIVRVDIVQVEKERFAAGQLVDHFQRLAGNPLGGVDLRVVRVTRCEVGDDEMLERFGLHVFFRWSEKISRVPDFQNPNTVPDVFRRVARRTELNSRVRRG